MAFHKFKLIAVWVQKGIKISNKSKRLTVKPHGAVLDKVDLMICSKLVNSK